MNQLLMAERISQIPKVELHVHVEAIVSYESYRALNDKNRVRPDLKTTRDFTSLFRIQSLHDMIQNFLFLQTLFHQPEDFSCLALDTERYCLDNNIKYIELHVSPSMVVRGGRVQFDDFMDVLVSGFDAMAARSGIESALIVDLSRSFGPENAAGNLDRLLSYIRRNPGKRIVGVGLGGQERGNPSIDYKPVLDRAKNAGLHVVVHAGEECGPEAVWEAVREVGAERIGHGTSAVQDKALLAWLAERGIPLEVCPTSNLVTGMYVQRYEDHPVRQFMDSGLLVTINTDDPILFNVSLNDEYSAMARHFRLGLPEIRKLVEQAVTASFAPAERKQVLLRQIAQACAV